MVYPRLDEEIKKAADAVTVEEVRKSYAYHHSILWYGLDALAHNLLVRHALQLQQEADLKTFLEKYDVRIGGVSYGTPVSEEGLTLVVPQNSTIGFPKKAVDGVSFPRYSWDSYKIAEYVHFVSGDYQNCFSGSLEIFPNMTNYPDGNEVLRELVAFFGQRQEPSVFLDKFRMKRVLQFSQHLWDYSVTSFEKHKHEQPARITQLGERLIAYYSQIVCES